MYAPPPEYAGTGVVATGNARFLHKQPALSLMKFSDNAHIFLNFRLDSAAQHFHLFQILHKIYIAENQELC